MATFIRKPSDGAKYFSFKLENENEEWIIPNTTVEGSDGINLSTSWSTQNVQGSTEAMTAFNHVNNPTLSVNLKFHEDLFREYQISHSYLETINKFASLAYPSEKNNKIVPPYVKIYFNNYIYRGFFTSIKITQSGPFRNGYRISCEISSQFTVVSKTAPRQSGVSSLFPKYFGGDN